MTATLLTPPRLYAPGWEPGARSIRDPIPLGKRADGSPVDLRLWRKDVGIRHPLLGGMQGSGKTNCLNCLIAGIVACRDAELWYIEVAKMGLGAAPWAGCIDWLGNTVEHAADILESARIVSRARSREASRDRLQGKGADKHQPSPEAPALFVVVDEGSACLSVETGTRRELAAAARAKEAATRLAKEGRENAVGLIVADQRPSHLNMSTDMRAQMSPRLCCRLENRRDVKMVLPSADLDAMDVSLFRYPGMLYMQDIDADEPFPIRSHGIYDPAAAHSVSERYKDHRNPLEPFVVDALGGRYTNRLSPAEVIRGGVDPTPDTRPDTRETITIRHVPSDHPATNPTPEDIADAAAYRDDVDTLLADAWKEADTPVPVAPPIPVDELAVSDTRPANVEDAVSRDLVLAHLAKVGKPTGARTVSDDAGIPRSTTYRVLRQLTDRGQVHVTGRKGSYRYELAP